ncbi:MAG TPA: glycosyltransferase family 4 protein [Polyangia bacterium]|nr:glycosyltransferase family 4 protein [Polyangia bacterium]
MFTQLACALGRRFDVTAICGQPVDEASFEGDLPAALPPTVRVVRVPHTRFAKQHVGGRLVNWASYALLTLVVGLSRRADVIIVATDPPILGVVACMLALWHRCPVITSCQDLYADVACRIGMVERGRAYGLLDAVTRWALRRSDLVVALSRDMASLLEAKQVSPSQIEIIPNWADTGAISPVERDDTNPIVRELDLRGRFTIMYAGNIGLAQDFESWLEALRQLDAPRESWTALVVGDGVRRGWLEQRIRELGISGNVRLLPRQPDARLPAVLGAASLHVVPLRKGLAGCVAPSKVYPILAAGRPFLAIADRDCEMTREAVEHGCGIWAPAGDAAAVRERLEWALAHVDELRRMGDRARLRAVACYDSVALLDRWTEAVSARSARRPSA